MINPKKAAEFLNCGAWHDRHAQEYLDLHSDAIKAAHNLSGDSATEFFLKATERQEGENNGMGELVYEISGEDSYSGNPVLFEVPEQAIMTEKDRVLLQAKIDRNIHDILCRIADREERSLSGQIRFILAAYVNDEYNYLQQKGYFDDKK